MSGLLGPNASEAEGGLKVIHAAALGKEATLEKHFDSLVDNAPIYTGNRGPDGPRYGVPFYKARLGSYLCTRAYTHASRNRRTLKIGMNKISQGTITVRCLVEGVILAQLELLDERFHHRDGHHRNENIQNPRHIHYKKEMENTLQVKGMRYTLQVESKRCCHCKSCFCIGPRDFRNTCNLNYVP